MISVLPVDADAPPESLDGPDVGEGDVDQVGRPAGVQLHPVDVILETPLVGPRALGPAPVGLALGVVEAGPLGAACNYNRSVEMETVAPKQNKAV